jgi:molybdate transport system substrate-binding protein
MKRRRRHLLHLSRIAVMIGFAIALAGTAQAAEIKLMSSGGMKTALIDLIPAFEGASTHKVTATYGAPGTVRGRIMAGEPVDVVVLPAPWLDDLVKQGKIVTDSNIILARSASALPCARTRPSPTSARPKP